MAINRAPGTAPPGKPRPKGDAQAVQHAWLTEHRGQLVGVRLLDGKVLSGRLVGFDTFTLALAREEGVLLLFKQGVAYCLPPSAVREPAARS